MKAKNSKCERKIPKYVRFRNHNEIFSKTPKKNFKSKDLDYCISTSKTFATSTEYLSYKYSIFSNDSYKNNSISNTNYLEFNQNFEKICLERESIEMDENDSLKFYSEASSYIEESSFIQYLQWRIVEVECPLQNLENDGGIFICKVIDLLSRDEHIMFSKEDINYFRISMSIELIESKLFS